MPERTARRILILLLVVVLALLGSRLGKSLFRSPNAAIGEEPSARVITWRLGLGAAAGALPRAAAERFVEQLTRQTQGRLQVTIHPASWLGGDGRMLELAGRGELSMVLLPFSTLDDRLDAMQLFDLPFFIPPREQLHAALDGDLGRMLLDRMRGLGLEGLVFWDGGARHFIGERPLLTPGALAGLRIAEPDDAVSSEMFKRFGARMIPGTPSSGQRDGDLQAAETTLLDLQDKPLPPQWKDLTLSGHALSGHVLAVSRVALDMLSGEQQKVLLESARETTRWERAALCLREGEIRKQLREGGVRLHELTGEQRESFQELLAYVPRKFEAWIGSDLLAKAWEWLWLHGEKSVVEQEILVGLDAQLSGESALAGLELSRGIRLAIDGINERGGVLGRRMRLLARDNHGLATRGLDNLQFFAGMENLVAVIGGQKSTVVAAEVEAVHALGLPFLLPWSAARHLTENGFEVNQVFRLSLNDRWSAPFLADAALARGRRIALVLENSSWGHDFEKIIVRHLHARGVRHVGVHWVDNGRKSFASLISRLDEDRVDVVVLVDTPDESLPFLLEIARSLPSVAVVSHWGLLGGQWTPEQLKVIGSMDLVFPQTSFPAEFATPQGQALQKAMRLFLGLGPEEPMVEMGSGFVQAYDLVRILASAIQAAGSWDRRAVRSAMEHMPVHEGLLRRLTPLFDAQRHDALGIEDYRLARMTPQGRIVPAEGR
ncbi:MAG: TRAP transporter substrate-binding protein DctP [Magnetococcales bacterium]|nr:TRAP transporter substrate-binding protein DctP [Magnetococcales bacterium]